MSDFKELIYDDVEFVTNRLHAPHRWDHMAPRKDSEETGAFVECTEEDLSAMWTIRFHFNARKKLNKKMGKFALVRGYKEDNENDRYIFAAKQNCKSSKTGKLNKQPTVVGPDLQPLANPKFSSGSRGVVKFNMLPTPSPSDKNWGITLYCKAVVVTEPKYFNNELEGMSGAKSYENLTEFLTDTENQPANEELEDEIPF